MEAIVASAFSRAGLLGNPSDGYGGQAIALAFQEFHARVEIAPAERFELLPGPSDAIRFDTVRDAFSALAADGCDDGLRLLRAALYRFSLAVPGLDALPADDPRLRFSMRYRTDIPRQVGLAGSSAIVVSALRALCAWFEVEIAPFDLAELALSAELSDLGIAAGAMDRVIQSHGGLLAMDLAEPRSPGAYRRLDPGRLPPLFVAWDRAGGKPSGRAHGDLRARWLAEDPEVLEVIASLRSVVDEGVARLEASDHDAFRELMNRNFDLRCRIFDVSERDRALVAVSRDAGGAAKLCGSGGAVVGMAPPGDAAAGLAALEQAYTSAGFGFLRPTPAPAVS